jgi:DNA-binding PadR family transcriptional regulator
MKTENTTRFAILGLLALEPMSGYDIRRAVQETLRHFWSESYGQIYPALAALEKDGLVRLLPQAAAARKSARPRKVYAPTPKGRRALAAWRKEPPVSRPFRNELLLRLFFGDGPSAPALLAHVTSLREEETRRLAEYDRLEARMLREAKAHPSLPYWLATLRYGRHRSTAVVEWCEETRRALSRARKP